VLEDLERARLTLSHSAKTHEPYESVRWPEPAMPPSPSRDGSSRRERRSGSATRRHAGTSSRSTNGCRELRRGNRVPDDVEE
jgi:hypothetical protein